MIPKKDPELIEFSIPMSFPQKLTPFQDKLSNNFNQQSISINITKQQKDFIIKTNKSTFYEFRKLYTKNVILKNKLKKLLNEKQKLSKIISKKENQIKNKNNEKKNVNNNDNNNNKIDNNLKYYKKRKRIRRKKNEIMYIYYCQFPNCNKSYPTKGSLNMHIKLKHNQLMIYNLNIK